MMENYQIMSNVSYFYVPCDSSDIIFWIDLIQHQKFQEKRNPFYGRFTAVSRIKRLDFGLQN